MKKTLTSFLVLVMLNTTTAQSVQHAVSMLNKERLGSAASTLHQIMKNQPENIHAWYWLAQTYLKQNRISELKDTLLKMPGGVVSSPLVRAVNGQIFLVENKQQQAKEQFDLALKDTKHKDPAVLRAIAYAHFASDSGKASEALDLVNKAIKRDKKNPELYILLGDINRKLLNGSEAYRAYEHALTLDRNNAIAKYKLGKIFLTQNNPEMYLKYFNEAVAADPSFAPALYELYYHYYFRDVHVAMDNLKKFIQASDPSISHQYMLTDLLYASRKYEEAIGHASELIQLQDMQAEPRLYKLIAYSYNELKNQEKAKEYMLQYFSRENDSNYVPKDFELMGTIYSSMPGKEDSTEFYYVRAMQQTTNDTTRLEYIQKLATLYSDTKNYKKQADWLGKYYAANKNSTNRNLFDWGVAAFLAKEYGRADSIFMIYEEKYPGERYGYYWRARSNAALDSNMEKGLAIPHYLKLVEIASQDTTDDVNRKRLIESYGYLAAYAANTEKNYASAIAYFTRLLALQPDNTDAKRYIEILQKNLASTKTN